MIHEYHRVTGLHEAVLDYTDLLSISLQGDGIQDFDIRWDQTLFFTREVPKDYVLESLYKMRMRGSVQLQSVLAMNEKEINQDRSRPSYQKLKAMVRRHIDQMIRTRIFKVRNERIETGVLVRTQKGKNVSVERKQGECNQWKASAQRKEMLAVSATTIVGVERKHIRPLLLQDRRHTMTEEDLRKEVPPEAVVPQEGNIQKRADIPLKGTVRIRRVIIWHPPVSLNYKSESGCT